MWWRNYMGAGQLKLYEKKKQEIPLILSLEVQHLTLDDITSLIFNPFNSLNCSFHCVFVNTSEYCGQRSSASKIPN